MNYVISDIHGEYRKLSEILDKINFSKYDHLYVLGDIIDRGAHPVKALQKLMTMPNVTCLVGNHELMEMPNLKTMMEETSEISLDKFTEDECEELLVWMYNGADTTIYEFLQLSFEERKDIVNFIGDFTSYEELCINGQQYILVHAGFDNFSKEKKPDDYSLQELVWTRTDYSNAYFDDKIVVSGHTPTQLIACNQNPGYIYKGNNHIAIDCGACMAGGRLATVCLETGEEFYV